MNVMLSSMSKIKKPFKYGGAKEGEEEGDKICRFAPNDFYHIISDLIELSSQNIQRKYYILVILISNDFINVKETVAKLVEASQKVK